MKILGSNRSASSKMIRRRLMLLIIPITLLSLLVGTAGTAGTARAAATATDSASTDDDAGDPSVGLPACDTQSPYRDPHPITMIDPQNGDNMGTAYLVYSVGCQTEWVTAHAYPPYVAVPSVWLQNQPGPSVGEALFSPDGGTYWTDQLGGMAHRAACGGVQMYYGLTGAWVGWYYIGCM